MKQAGQRLMKMIRNTVIRAGLEALYFSGAHYLLRPIFAGVGGIFMLHHVRPRREAEFQPNHHLEVEPDFLRAVLAHLRAIDVDIVTMDEAHARLSEGNFARRFACFTLDDGYRDNRDFALPVMREFDAPMTVYVASDFAEGTGKLWWVALEKVLAKANSVEAPIGGMVTRFDTSSPAMKQHAFERLHDWLRSLPGEHDMQREISALCTQHDVDEAAIARDLCMSWDELKQFADDPLVTIGAHTITHCNLAKQTDATATFEIATSRMRIEAALQRQVLHLAYPYGDKIAAGPREFAIAKAAGFKTAVTTRPGMLFPESAAHITALQRVSLNGNFQEERIIPVLTSGAATAVWIGFRRIDAA
jgi:peptidoglycan/xylan/chitin deacetylase (PgdA/CDA1 family)